MRLLILLLLCLAFSDSSRSACTFLPENNVTIPISEKSEGLSEAQYHQVIDKFAAKYTSILEKISKTLTIHRLWEDPRVNAATTRKGNEVILRLYGGFARHPKITQDGYALVLCHELGHHLGGAPKKDLAGASWASTEGQADYYATLKCLRKVFRDDDNLASINEMKVPLLIKEQCSMPFKTDWEKALCIRTAMAGIDVANVMSKTKREEAPDVSNPDQSVVDSTMEAHPGTQCRLDTYFQGSICEVSSYKPVSSKDERRGTCHPLNGHQSGIRPGCWFAHSLN
ncbi:MAG: hypothetical protein NDI69_17025 [Bacteriovoracaceae bacterium]|nr:hypothetical protein [Bacteriovoracaceae bacterium]